MADVRIEPDLEPFNVVCGHCGRLYQAHIEVPPGWVCQSRNCIALIPKWREVVTNEQWTRRAIQEQNRLLGKVCELLTELRDERRAFGDTLGKKEGADGRAIRTELRDERRAFGDTLGKKEGADG